MVDQEVATQGIKMSRRVEWILVTRQKIIVLPRIEPTIIEGVDVIIRIKYNEPKLNQQSGSIVRGVPREWSRKIHSVNKFQDLTFHVAHTTIILDIRSMNVHLLKIM